jgi:hypothetical protein
LNIEDLWYRFALSFFDSSFWNLSAKPDVPTSMQFMDIEPIPTSPFAVNITSNLLQRGYATIN